MITVVPPRKRNLNAIVPDSNDIKTFFDMHCDVCKVQLSSLQHAKLHYLEEHNIPDGYIKVNLNSICFFLFSLDFISTFLSFCAYFSAVKWNSESSKISTITFSITWIRVFSGLFTFNSINHFYLFDVDDDWFIARIDVKYVWKYFHERQIWVHICPNIKLSIRKNSAATSVAKFGNQNIVWMFINGLMKKKLPEHFRAIIAIESM